MYVNLQDKAKKLRKDVIELSQKYGDPHLGSCFSEIEILVSLYIRILKDEDIFILSKGHACHPLYLLLMEKGYNPEIKGHPDMDLSNGISCTTGSLGHGLPIGVGRALARKKTGKNGMVYVLMGDGECQEGTTWESSLIASYHKLSNLTVIVDYNKLQALDSLDNILSLGDIKKKFEALGYNIREVDGHNFDELINGLERRDSSMPNMVIANTIKGKGVSFMESDPKWHARPMNETELKQAYKELK